MALVNAVALPGGYTHRSVPSKITVKRRLHLGRRARPVVLPGEIITVPEPFIWPGERARLGLPPPSPTGPARLLFGCEAPRAC
jgi:hypothetical protein